MQKFKLLPHTADLRIKVFGRTYEELFQNAVFGLFSVLLEKFEELAKRRARPTGFEKIRAGGMNASELLVNFLNAVLTESQIRKKAYYRVKFLKLGEKNLEAQIFGFSVQKFDRDVKAVTYHDAEIAQNKRGMWETELTLDI